MDWLSWVKALHVFTVIAWMAGMLYLPRLYVYHAGAEVGSDKSETFKIMERRLLRGILNPSMIVAWICGVIMFIKLEYWTEGWMHAKWFGIIGLSTLHGLYARWRKDFERDQNTRPAVFYRIWNEVPVIFLILIIVMVVVKPF
ncbi:MAG: protoporphyrinogen oxidase HemJ [Rhodospirillaceae bacterium]|nr:protoporphyrinogen oxidase HemJ [Rhodospirillaceae bacterium]MCY4238698.1 protoporphyrinogen oxidase HemJ [Rhodospirillaceae bacterium]MCY4312038.1 protoporphyrinogen oxidase HemJ [Rhodospirillaceae bacterium]